MSKLIFQAPSSSFDPSFWEEPYRLKLNVHKLNMVDIKSALNMECSDGDHISSYLFSNTSFIEVLKTGLNIEGVIKNVNTIEEFRDCDKRQLLSDYTKNVLNVIMDKSAIKDPSLLQCFLLLVYSDLKAYRFTYWFGLGALVPEISFSGTNPVSLKLVNLGNGDNLSYILYKTIISSLKESFHIQCIFGFYLENSKIADPNMEKSDELRNITTSLDHSYSVLTTVPPKLGKRLSLEEAWVDRYDPCMYFVVLDSGNSEEAFGWSVRNFLALLSLHHPTENDAAEVNVIGLRGSLAKKIFSTEKSKTMDYFDESWDLSQIQIENSDKSIYSKILISGNEFENLKKTDYKEFESLKIVGWEVNERGKPGPRVADLSGVLSGERLMAQAVDLNLRLMRWRMWPQLDTEKLANTKCLLLGSGTLGCAVARVLLGWGVRHITLVDSGLVSYSNPARQCLFEYEDCRNRSPKAIAAANSLKRIFPDVRAEGVILGIPMPGHPFRESEAESKEVELKFSSKDTPLQERYDDAGAYFKLEELIKTHDVCYILTDSREARWLPTAMCAANDKLLINSALGFDSYVVMRHGVRSPTSSDKLGCYFCNDIVAATNSQKDRSLDQQCTVTRPGLSFQASALAVEMMVALLHSPFGPQHPAPRAGTISEDNQKTENEAENENIPLIPHQIRGSLVDFSQITPYTPAFNCCTACSDPITEKLRNKVLLETQQSNARKERDLDRGMWFVRSVCDNPSILEKISGAAELMAQVDLGMGDLDLSDDDF